MECALELEVLTAIKFFFSLRNSIDLMLLIAAGEIFQRGILGCPVYAMRLVVSSSPGKVDRLKIIWIWELMSVTQLTHYAR